jgi:hypothetical protein
VLRRVLVTVIVLAVGCLALGAGAGASVPSSPRPSAGFDGRVRIAVASGNTVYLGGISPTPPTWMDGS